jgi:xanthine dehydrogenase YagR molybdenum-binding subunit
MTQPLGNPSLAVGKPISRVDGRVKVTGAARYAADNQFPDLVHAALVCSTIAHGAVTGIDSGRALEHPGVLRVLADFSGVKLAFDPRQVSFFGQPVAVVVAATLEAAVHGATLVSVRYSAEPSLTDIDAPAAVQQAGDETPDYSRGDADAALRTAAVVADLKYTVARNYHNPMELPSTIASWDGDQLTVWDKVQGITQAQDAMVEGSSIGLW